MESRIEERLIEYVQQESAALPEGLYVSLMNLCAEHHTLREKVVQMSESLRHGMTLMTSICAHARKLEQDNMALKQEIRVLKSKRNPPVSCVETRSMKKACPNSKK